MPPNHRILPTAAPFGWTDVAAAADPLRYTPNMIQMINKTTLVAILLATLASASLAATPWEDYLITPSPERASKVQSRTYSKPNSHTEQEERDLMLLGVQVLSRDPEAVRLAFRFCRAEKAAAHLSEMLDEMLGRLIRIDAPLFLRELKRVGVDKIRMDSLVGNFGEEYVDRIEAQAYETEQRIQSLRRVTDPSLKEVRDRCLLELKAK